VFDGNLTYCKIV